MSNIIDITRRLALRRSYDYASGTEAITRARRLTDDLQFATEGCLVVPVDAIWPAVCELRAIIHAEATWPDDSPKRSETS